MRYICLLFLFFTLVISGCAHNSPVPVTSRIIPAQPEMTPAAPQPQDAAVPAIPVSQFDTGPFEARRSLELSAKGAGEKEDDEYYDEDEEEGAGLEGAEGKQATPISDPLEKFNRAMFTFNDRLYYWVLKPVAQGYAKVVPEAPRVSVNNFFNNLGFPVRFVSMLLQVDFSGAAAELLTLFGASAA